MSKRTTMSDSQYLWRIFYCATVFLVLMCQAVPVGCYVLREGRTADILAIQPNRVAESSSQIPKLTFKEGVRHHSSSLYLIPALSRKICCFSYCFLFIDVTWISSTFYSHLMLYTLFSLSHPRDTHTSAFHLGSSIRFLCCIQMSGWIKTHSSQNALFEWEKKTTFYFVKFPTKTNMTAEFYRHFT